MAMNDLQKEINELKQFMVDLKADRAAAKQKEKSEAWTKYVSLTVVIIAVFAAVANQYSGRYGSQVQINQVKASDQWSYYEAKSIKQHLDVNALVQLQDSVNATNPVVVKAIKKLTDDLSRYEKQLTDAKAEAQAFEAKRDLAAKQGVPMGLAVTVFSVAIATASICTVTKKKPLWFAAMGMSAFGLYKMIEALLTTHL